MKKNICGKVYDTEKAAVVKKLTFGQFGDPDGYEKTLYFQTDIEKYFVYTNGGADSPYPEESIKRISEEKAVSEFGL